MTRFLAAAIQMTSTEATTRNLARAEALIEEAASRGATLVCLPENFAYLRAEGTAIPSPQALDGEWLSWASALARRTRVTLLAGTIVEAPGDSAGGRPYNTCVVFGSQGERLAVYRKIHLFDIDLPGLEHLKESKGIAPGSEVVVAQTPQCRLGLSICYDLRFPELYRTLTLLGAEVLAVPSAFTERTGRDHWEVLLRARAVENLAYVLAPAQYGKHATDRISYGHALIAGPWGEVLAQAPDGEGMALAEIDLDRQQDLRSQLPALSHRRLDLFG